MEQEHAFLIFAITFGGFLALGIYGTLTRYNIGIKGKCIWKDEGKNIKPFFSHRYHVYGKPDLLYETDEGIVLIEYKSRGGKIYPSDIAQAKCAALAARDDGYNIHSIAVKTVANKHIEVLPESNDCLYEDIEQYIHAARAAKSGSFLPTAKDPGKCHGCGYKNSCNARLVA